MSYRMWRSIAIVAFALLLAPISARAADDFYRFQSALPGNACINVPMGQFQPGVQLQVAPCNGSPVQSFGYESQNNLTAGGLCLDGISSARGQPPAAGDPVGLNECEGSDHQVWELQPFDNNRNEIAIVNPAGLCVAVNGANAAPGTPLVLAACDEIPPQGWVFGDVPRPVAVNGVGGYAAYPELDYYWLSGHRYCWYDGGWHGGGWYWCGENFHNGIGWGGPIGWHFWFHHGQHYFPHRVAFKGVHGQGGHQHGPGGLKLAPATGQGKKQGQQVQGPGKGQGAGPGKKATPTTGSNTGTRGPGTEKKTITHTGTSTGTGTHKTFANTGTHTRTTFTRSTGGGGHPTGGGGGGHPGGGGGGHPGGGGGGGGGGGHHKSDIRLKQDIVELGRLADGIGIYRFRYTNGDPTTYVGVMAQEVQEVVPSAVSRDRDGYLMVNYDRIGLRFMTWDQWSRRHDRAGR